MLARACLLTVLATVTPMLTACWDQDEKSFYIVNETGQTVTVSGGGGSVPSCRTTNPARYQTNECNSADLVAVYADGTEAASVTEEWCAKRLMAHPGRRRVLDPGSD